MCLCSAVLTVICFLFVPETYAPTILRKRAALLSKVTGKVYRAPMDAKKPLQITALFKTSLSRPWALLFTEPIVLLISIYMAIVYGTLYMLFAAFPYVESFSPSAWSSRGTLGPQNISTDYLAPGSSSSKYEVGPLVSVVWPSWVC